MQKKAADQLVEHVGPYVKDISFLEGFMPTPMLILVRFHQWEDILKLPQPDPNMAITTALWHFARGMAYAATWKTEKAGIERKAFTTIAETLPLETPFGPRNKASDILKIAQNVLDAKMAMAQGNKKSAIELLRKAVEVEDNLNYDEPPSWFLPVRESLGGALLLDGDPAEAEKVFRADLKKNPRNGRSLFGLMESLKAQGKTYEAQWVQREFGIAWKNTDTQLRVEDL